MGQRPTSTHQSLKGLHIGGFVVYSRALSLPLPGAGSRFLHVLGCAAVQGTVVSNVLCLPALQGMVDLLDSARMGCSVSGAVCIHALSKYAILSTCVQGRGSRQAQGWVVDSCVVHGKRVFRKSQLHAHQDESGAFAHHAEVFHVVRVWYWEVAGASTVWAGHSGCSVQHVLLCDP